MDHRGKYVVCSVCPRHKDCNYCSEGHRNDLARGRDNDIDAMDLVGVALGVATGIAVGNFVEDVFDLFD